jgi:membrane protein YqaA with SNARE-associated domain
MKIFSQFYIKVLTWAQHKYSIYYLAFLSAVESFILPYPPPDIMLAPMALKKLNKAYYFALITTIFSVIGGVIGYILGYFFLDLISPIITNLGYDAKLITLKEWFNEYGVLIVFVAGFSPVPYKIFTIGGGIMAMSFLPFVLISFISRGLRFYLVAFFVRKYGEKCDDFLRKYIDYLGYLIIILAIIFIGYKSFS